MVWCDVLWFSVILETSTSQTNNLSAIKFAGYRQMYIGRYSYEPNAFAPNGFKEN